MSMHNAEQFGPTGPTLSDSKLGTDDPLEEDALLEGQLIDDEQSGDGNAADVDEAADELSPEGSGSGEAGG